LVASGEKAWGTDRSQKLYVSKKRPKAWGGVSKRGSQKSRKTGPYCPFGTRNPLGVKYGKRVNYTGNPTKKRSGEGETGVAAFPGMENNLCRGRLGRKKTEKTNPTLRKGGRPPGEEGGLR